MDKYLPRNALLSRRIAPMDGGSNVTVTGHFGARRVRARAGSRAAKMKRARASPGRTSDSAALSTAEVRAKRALKIILKMRISFNYASRSSVKIPDSDIRSSEDLVCFQTVRFTREPLFIR